MLPDSAYIGAITALAGAVAALWGSLRAERKRNKALVDTHAERMKSMQDTHAKRLDKLNDQLVDLTNRYHAAQLRQHELTGKLIDRIRAVNDQGRS